MRDSHFLGLHSDPQEEAELDLYGTLAEKTWTVDVAWLKKALARGHADFLAACPDDAFTMPRTDGLNPVPWTIGHVAFTFDSIVADPLQLPKGAEREEAWKFYDSMRIGHGTRWSMHSNGEAPDGAAARAFLAAVHKQAEELVEARAEGGTVPPIVSYLLVYALVHELWHTEDVVHTRHVHRLPPPALRAPYPVGAQEDAAASCGGEALGDAHVPGGVFHLGAARDVRFVLDCEK